MSARIIASSDICPLRSAGPGAVLDEARKSGSISFDNLCLLVPEDATIGAIEELIAVLEAQGIVVDEVDDDTLEADGDAMLEALRDFIETGRSMTPRKPAES